MNNQISNHSPSKGTNHAANLTARTKLQAINSKQLEPKLERELLESGIPKNEICRIAYLLQVNGAKFNLEYLPVKGKRPIDLNGNYLKDWTNKQFSIKECLAAKGVTGIGLKCGINLLCLDFDGASAFDLALEEGINWPMNEGWEVRRDDEPWRYKQLFTPTPEQIDLLPNGEFQGKVVTKEAVKNANGKVIKKAEALEVFLTSKRQVVILGKHPDGGNYFWPTNNEPENLKPITPPSDAIWNFVLKVANQKKIVTRKAKNPSPRGTWRPARPCPVCSRTRDNDCSVNSADNFVLCHHGKNDHPPILNKGETIQINGITWAFCGIGNNHHGDCKCSKFKIHKPKPLAALARELGVIK